MINTMIGTVATSPEIFNPFVLIFIGGIACTIFATCGGYIWGRNATSVESARFWAMQKEIEDKNIVARHEKKMQECEKGLETRRRREGVIVNGTECER